MRISAALPALLTVLAGAVLIAGVSLAMSLLVDENRSPSSVASATLKAETAPRPERTLGLEILRAWDERRAAAWSAGDEAALGALYTDRSVAGVADRAMLRRWRARDLVVESMQTQVRGATVIVQGERRVVIAVTDRLVGARAVGQSGQAALPRDRWSTRRVTLRWVKGQWLVAGVRPG